MSTAQRSRADLAGLSIADVVTGRGKELVVGSTVASARRLFENASVQVIPVLDGGHGYEVPGDACASYRSMLDRLRTLEVDTHRHVHEENNVLFPRAIEMEADRR